MSSSCVSAIRMGRPKKNSDEYDEFIAGKRARRDRTPPQISNGSTSTNPLDYPEPFCHSSEPSCTQNSNVSRTASYPTEYREDFSQGPMPHSSPDLKTLYELALQEQENMQMNTASSSKRSSENGSVSSPGSHMQSMSPLSTSAEGSSVDTSCSSLSDPTPNQQEIFIPEPYDSILEEMFNRQFWKQRHVLLGVSGLNPVQSQLLHLLCASYDQLFSTTEEPPNTAAFFEHSSRVSRKFSHLLDSVISTL